jgi:hypothetical protein
LKTHIIGLDSIQERPWQGLSFSDRRNDLTREELLARFSDPKGEAYASWRKKKESGESDRRMAEELKAAKEDLAVTLGRIRSMTEKTGSPFSFTMKRFEAEDKHREEVHRIESKYRWPRDVKGDEVLDAILRNQRLIVEQLSLPKKPERKPRRWKTASSPIRR